MQKITPFLWFENNAQEAAEFYVKVFSEMGDNSTISNVTYYDQAGADASGREVGSVMTVAFELDGQEFVALNGGPYFKFSGAVSFVVNCQTQEEIDHFWEKLSEGGESGQCGWINRDKYGVTWQVVPVILQKLLQDPDKRKAQNVMKAMLKMNKMDIQKLLEAYDK